MKKIFKLWALVSAFFFVVSCSGKTKPSLEMVSTMEPSEENQEQVAEEPDEIGEIGVIIKTSKGEINVTLFANKTPVTVTSFLNLAKHGYYDGLVFHRVIDNFMIQGGDPEGTGMGGPGYNFEDEFHPSLRHDSAGILSMANPGRRNMNGSQLFITHTKPPWLDDKHSVFGRVTGSMSVVNAIKQGDTIESIEILDSTDKLFDVMSRRIEEWNRYLGK